MVTLIFNTCISLYCSNCYYSKQGQTHKRPAKSMLRYIKVRIEHLCSCLCTVCYSVYSTYILTSEMKSVSRLYNNQFSSM